jgi:hypothetical protein
MSAVLSFAVPFGSRARPPPQADGDDTKLWLIDYWARKNQPHPVNALFSFPNAPAETTQKRKNGA